MDLQVNGATFVVEGGGGRRLSTVLRDDLGLTGTKEACGQGECGACTVLMDGRPVMACVLPVGLVSGPITTIEGLAEVSEPIRAAFADTGGFQCGFCTPGQIVRAVALLADSEDELDDAMIRRSIVGNICRCTGYSGIVAAIQRVQRAG